MSSFLPPLIISGESSSCRKSWMNESDERMSEDARLSWMWFDDEELALEDELGGGGAGVGDWERMKNGLRESTT
jgi:hypothetical protein